MARWRNDKSGWELFAEARSCIGDGDILDCIEQYLSDDTLRDIAMWLDADFDLGMDEE